MEILSPGQPQTCVPHPTDPSRSLFLAFDQSHIIKNVQSQFLARKLGKNGKISSIYIKDLYKMQQGSMLKPFCFLMRKHLYPSDIEKMGVRHAVQLFSPAVTTALFFMKDHAGHTCNAEFANASPTFEFMKNICRWFTLMDVSNCQHTFIRTTRTPRSFLIQRTPDFIGWNLFSWNTLKTSKRQAHRRTS